MPAPPRPGRSPLLAALDEARRELPLLGEQILAHQPDLADRQAQRLLDSWVDHAADALRAVGEALEDRMLELARPTAEDRSAAPRISAPPDTLDTLETLAGSERPGTGARR